MANGERPPTPEEVGLILKDMRLVDDEFMKVALDGRADCLQLIARAALGDDSLVVEGVTGQRELPNLPKLHGSRLDFLCRAADGRLVNVEVESASSEKFPPRRARFYSALVDAWSLGSGARYTKLPDSALIVVSEGDQLRLGLQRCTVRRRVDERDAAFDDGSVIVYVSCENRDEGTALGRVAHDMLCADPDEMYNPELADCARAVKRMGAEMGTYWQDLKREIYSDGLAMGLAEGEARGEARAYFDLVGDGLLAIGDAAGKLGVTESEFARRAAEAGYTIA